MKTVLYPTSRKTFKSQLDQRAARIVIIDDKGSIRSSVRLALQLQEIVKFRFYEASNITDGRALISQIHPELVILDLNMPGGDGFQLVDELRSDPQLRGTHILIMTSENSREICFAWKIKRFQADRCIASWVNHSILKSCKRLSMLTCSGFPSRSFV